MSVVATAVRTAGGSRVVALTSGKTGTYISVDGARVTKLDVPTTPDAAAIAKALDIFDDATVLVIGTKPDGTPGWEHLDNAELVTATPHTVVFVSEGQALHRAHTGGKAAYLILATAVRGANTVGSARVWIQDDSEAVPADVFYGGTNFGQLYRLSGTSLAVDPAIVAGMVESLLAAHPDVQHVYVWSQDGLNGLKAYEDGGFFWKVLRLPQEFVEGEGKVEIIPTAFTIMTLASAPRPVATEDTIDDEKDSDA